MIKYNNYDFLKAIAFILMIVDHIGYYFFPYSYLLRAIGRGSAILFAILFGLIPHKRNYKVLVSGIITSIIFLLFDGNLLPLNIMFNFYLSYYLIDYIEYLYNKSKIIFYILIFLIVNYISYITSMFFEYGIILILLIFCGKLMSKENKDINDKFSIFIILLSFYLYQIVNFRFSYINSILVLFIFLVVFMLTYNFKLKEMKENKFMMFLSRKSVYLYPIHLLIINIILLIIKQLWY